jgi:hypothetical protein
MGEAFDLKTMLAPEGNQDLAGCIHACLVVSAGIGIDEVTQEVNHGFLTGREPVDQELTGSIAVCAMVRGHHRSLLPREVMAPEWALLSHQNHSKFH